MSIVDGIDTKTDDKNVISTKFLELENLIFTKTGSLSKRLGYQGLTRNVLESDALTAGSALSTFNGELLAYSNNNLYTYSEAETKWVDKGAADIGLASATSVASNGDVYTSPYFCTLDNLSCYVFLATTLTTSMLIYKIIDNTTGALISSGEIGTGSAPRVQALGGKFIISYIVSSTLKYVAIVAASPSSVTAPATVLAATAQFDCKRVGDRLFFLAGKTASGGIQVLYMNADLTLSSAIAVEASGTFTRPDVSDFDVNSVRLCYVNNTPAVKTIIYTYDLTVSSGAAEIVGEFPVAVSAVNKQTFSALYISYKYSASPASYNRVLVVTVDADGTTIDAVSLFEQAIAQTKAVTLNSVDYFIVCKDESQLTQRAVRTYFLVNSNGRIISKYDEDNSVVLSQATSSTYLTNLETSGQQIVFAGAALAEFQSEATTAAGGLVAPTVIRRYVTDFTATSNYFDAKLGGNLHVVGGTLKAYDGGQMVEHGFLEVPRTPVLSSTASNGTDPGLGSPDGATSYQYIVVYAWRDNQGQLHRSCPSAALTVNVSAATPNFTKVFVKVPTLTMTNKQNVEIELYRTEANGTTFYRLVEGGPGAWITRSTNDKSVSFLTYEDEFPDDAIVEGELLYTTGGVLENIAAPASKFAVTYKNRVLLLSADGLALHYSKLREINGPVEFNDSLVIPLDEFGGPATALAVMDDHVIIFKEKAIFALTGEGPNNLGQQDDFRQPYLITSDAGCIEPNSVVRTPDAVLFKSDKGIYALARNFQSSYVGAAVELYNSHTVSSANLLETTNEIRFTTTEGRTLVYDYFHNRWTTFTNMPALDALNYNNQYSYIRSDGVVLKETADYYYDQGSYIKTKLVSAWISLAGIQGFERVYQLEILGNYKASHKLRVSLAYDFVNSYLHDTVINATTALSPAYYGVGAYGAGSPYGGDGLLYQFRVYPKIQKCQAFKLCIEDFPGTATGGEAYTLSNIAATVGIKSGLNKVPAGRSYGTR